MKERSTLVLKIGHIFSVCAELLLKRYASERRNRSIKNKLVPSVSFRCRT